MVGEWRTEGTSVSVSEASFWNNNNNNKSNEDNNDGAKKGNAFSHIAV